MCKIKMVNGKLVVSSNINDWFEPIKKEVPTNYLNLCEDYFNKRKTPLFKYALYRFKNRV